MRFATRWIAACAGSATLLLAAGCGGGNDDNEPAAPATVRATAYGNVEGSVDTATRTLSWKGVPYARPPVGDLRWKPPLEPVAWTSTLQAKKFGRSCSSVGGLYGPGLNDTWDASLGATIGNNTPVGAEDCLTLNIWRPASNATNLPVVLFIHGGSNVTGYSADPMFQGAHLAQDANVVAVNMNYRLGVFGFFNMAELKTGEPLNDSGNFAILDLIQVLKFVKANIAAFGGDPNNVTVSGQSAGAGNVWALVVSARAAGLFHKAVPMSGPPPSARTATTTNANNLYWNLLINAGRATDLASAQAYAATQTPAQIATFMRSVAGPTVMATAGAKGLNAGGAFTDGTVVPADPFAAIAAGNYNQVPILSGNVAEEGKLFTALNVTQAQLFPILYAYNADSTPPPTVTLADIIRPANLPVSTPSTGWNAVSAASPIATAVQASIGLNAVKAKQSNLWAYRFDWRQETAPWNDVYGASHVFDVAFWLGNFDPSVFTGVIVSKANEPGRLALSKAMMASLAAFARTGDPNNGELGLTWPAWPAKLIFNADNAQKALSVQ